MSRKLAKEILEILLISSIDVRTFNSICQIIMGDKDVLYVWVGDKKLYYRMLNDNREDEIIWRKAFLAAQGVPLWTSEQGKELARNFIDSL